MNGVNDVDYNAADFNHEATDVTVYVVEDSAIIVRILTELIETTGARVVGDADTATIALREIAVLHPDVVTIDIQLKGGTGYDVLEGIAINSEEIPPTRIMLTNCIGDEYREAAHALGADYFFDKAREIGKTLTVLAQVAEHRHLGVA
ncbi:MAG TPA: response regulator [Casimicrobiaceae bacterium]|jgi:CheY-like chemotaxis protein